MSEETIPIHPYLRLLEQRDPAEVLAEMPARLGALLDRFSSEQVEYRPAPGKWNVREIMAHLADCEIAWGWRFRQIYGEENPTLQPFEQDAWAKAYGSYSFSQARETWTALRGWNLAFLGGLSAADQRRPALHPEMGTISLWTVVGVTAGHDLHHLRSLEHVAARL